MPEPLSPARLAEIRERADSATPAPWGVGNSTEIALDVDQTSPGCFSYTVKLASVVEDDDRQDDVYYLKGADQLRVVASAEDDALFIAHSRQDVDDLLAEVDRLRTPPPPGELRGLDAMCAALHAATETDPVVKEVAWRTFALIRAHREQSVEVDRLKADRDRLRHLYEDARDRCNEAEEKVFKVAKVKVWKNEDRRGFVFVEDLCTALGVPVAEAVSK